MKIAVQVGWGHILSMTDNYDTLFSVGFVLFLFLSCLRWFSSYRGGYSLHFFSIKCQESLWIMATQKYV